MHTVEELREVLHAVQSENAALRLSASHSRMLAAGLEALLIADESTDPFTIVFRSLRQVFDHTCALALTEQDGELSCIASDDPALIGKSWPVGPLQRKVLKGRASAALGYAGSGSQTCEIAPGRPALYLPIKVMDKRGALALLRPAGTPGFDRNDIALGERFAILSSQALSIRSRRQTEHENRKLEELTRELEHRAYYDELTGLANRALLKKRVEEALAARTRDDRFALVFLDVDKFKQINEYFSPSVGDKLLIQIANRIRGVARETDALGRISGDEFLMLVSPLEGADTLAAVIDAVRSALNAPFWIEGHEIQAGVSIGASLCPAHGVDFETLRRNADSAMSRAKTSNTRAPVIYDDALGQARAARLELERRLRVGIRDESFFPVLQPKIDLNAGAVTGFEALVRWRDEWGVVHAPGAFIGVATELRLLDDVTRIMVAKTLETFAVLDPAFGDDTSIAVNIAPSQANDVAFMTRLAADLERSGYARRIVLELTEDAMVAATEFSEEVQPMLLDLGLRVSIDDFGTGYSCLSALADIKADELKIDRSFVTDVHKDRLNQRILFTVENLAQAIGLKMVAEGVETREELDFLLRHTSIDIAQGYLFSKPMPAGELAALGPGLCPPSARRVIREPDAASMR